MCNLRKEKPTVTLKLHLFRSEIVLLHLAELQMMECSVILRIVSSPPFSWNQMERNCFKLP